MGTSEFYTHLMTLAIYLPLGFVVTAGLGRILWRVGSQIQPKAAATPLADPRIDRMELAIESIAVEVERISEAQRFTVALLSKRIPGSETDADRVSELPLIAPKKQITPH